MIAMQVIGPDEDLQIACAQRVMTLKWADLGHYDGERGRRGSLLPRGWRKVDRLVRLVADGSGEA